MCPNFWQKWKIQQDEQKMMGYGSGTRHFNWARWAQMFPPTLWLKWSPIQREMLWEKPQQRRKRKFSKAVIPLRGLQAALTVLWRVTVYENRSLWRWLEELFTATNTSAGILIRERLYNRSPLSEAGFDFRLPFGHLLLPLLVNAGKPLPSVSVFQLSCWVQQRWMFFF